MSGSSWRIGLLLLATFCVPVTAAESSSDLGLTVELRRVLEKMQDRPVRKVSSFTAKLPGIRVGGKHRIALPQLELFVGRLDLRRCVYQLRLKLRWSGQAPIDDSTAPAGRPVLRQTECATLADEVSAAALQQVAFLRQRAPIGGSLVSNAEPGARPARPRDAEASAPQSATEAGAESAPRDDLALAAIAAAPQASASATPFVAWVGAARLMLRAAPSAKAPLMQRLAPGTRLLLLPSAEPGWFALVEGSGFVAEVGIVRNRGETGSQPGAAP